jgi:hypothetical protein
MGMRITRFSLLLIFSILMSSWATAQTTYSWAFTGGSAAPTTTGITNFTVSNMGIGNPQGTVSTPIVNSSASSGYTGASGTFNIGNAPLNGTLDTTQSSYFAFSVTNNTGNVVNLTDFDFGIRSSPSGATVYTLFHSQDGFTTSIFNGTISNNSTWAYKDNSFTSHVITSDNVAREFRLYISGGSNAVASTIATRMDDVVVTFTPVPEPTAMLGLSAVVLVVCYTRLKLRLGA